MRISAKRTLSSSDQTRRDIAARLRQISIEIHAATQDRVLGLMDASELGELEYTDGLRTAVVAAIGFGIDALERGDEQPGPVPTCLLSQARLAARSGVSLDKVLRRYFGGYAVLGDFVAQELENCARSEKPDMKRLLRIQAAAFDQLVEAVTKEHGEESKDRATSTERRRKALVSRLLAGEVLEAAQLDYEFDAWHLGAIFWGGDGAQAAREISRRLDRRLLLIRHGDDTFWVWLGGRECLPMADVLTAFEDSAHEGVNSVYGEPGKGLAGWRATFQQSRAAFPVAMRQNQHVTRYRDVALLASLSQDDLLTRSLREIYMAPLETSKDAGDTLKATLRTFISRSGNVSSTAAAMGVNRHTVSGRLKSIEELLGRSLDSCLTEIDAALRLETLPRG